jgi:hypothetical protein
MRRVVAVAVMTLIITGAGMAMIAPAFAGEDDGGGTPTTATGGGGGGGGSDTGSASGGVTTGFGGTADTFTSDGSDQSGTRNVVVISAAVAVVCLGGLAVRRSRSRWSGEQG